MIEDKTKVSALSLLFNTILEFLVIEERQHKEIKGREIGKEDIKLYLPMAWLPPSQISRKVWKTQTPIELSLATDQDTGSWKSIECLYANSKHVKTKIKNTVSCTISQKKKKTEYLGINLTKQDY